MARPRPHLLILTSLLAGSAALAAAQRTAPDPDARAASVLAERCLRCHGEERKGGLDLRTRESALKGGAHGPALVPHNAAESALYRHITGQAQPAMPPDRPLSSAETALLKDWLNRGATWPALLSPTPNTQRPTPTWWSFQPPRRPAVPQITDTRWKGWVRNPVDAFVLQRLLTRGLTPSPSADRRTLIRRVYLDLTGLPPAPEAVEAFVNDRDPSAYEKVVDGLLASPHYGERWAQHWLDVVRFGETNGFELDQDRPQAWRYRDWVIQALNADMPYDHFLQLQIAGDELEPGDWDAHIATGFLRGGPQHVVGGNTDPAVNRQEWLTEAVAGIGTAVMGVTIQCARCHDHKFDPVSQADYYRLQAFFAAADNTTVPHETPGAKEAYEAALRKQAERLKPIQAQIAEIEKPYREQLRREKIARLELKYQEVLAIETSKRTPAQAKLASEVSATLKIDWNELVAALRPGDKEKRAALRRQMHAIEAEAPEPLPAALAVSDVLQPVPTLHVLIRGDVHTPGAEAPPAFPAALVRGAGGAPTSVPVPPDVKSTGRRLALARWLTRPDHPLTARVLVNRVWQGHFGKGLVGTPNDFGKNGQAPTHPELLDWLATDFVAGLGSWALGLGEAAPNAQGLTPNAHPWSLKRLHRLIVLSSAYRQSSVQDAAKAKRDPDNKLLWRMNARRLDAEALRDSILRVSGTLNEAAGGPAIRVPLEPEVYDTIFTESEPDNLWPLTPDPRQHTRRSIYLLRKRNVRLPLLAVFDQPDMMSSCAARGQSVHALQSLTLLNSPFMQGQSEALAARLFRGEPADEGRRVARLYRLALGRAPRPAERDATTRFLREQTALVRDRITRGETVSHPAGLPAGTDPASAAAWTDLSLAMLNLNDFVYLR